MGKLLVKSAGAKSPTDSVAKPWRPLGVSRIRNFVVTHLLGLRRYSTRDWSQPLEEPKTVDASPWLADAPTAMLDVVLPSGIIGESEIRQLVEEKIASNQMLDMVDLTLVRSLCEDHNRTCNSCGRCVFCTTPHHCCCGKCGPDCAHDHAPLRHVCHQMQELSHG